MNVKPSFFFNCADEHKMPVYEWLPGGDIKGVLLIAHGLAEHASRYARFAAFLNREGIAVFADDHRGHGYAVSSETMAGIAGDDWVNRQIMDFRELLLYLKNRFKELPVFLMGHSMGSFLAQRFVQLYSCEIDGLILSATSGYKDPMLPAGIFISKLLMILRGPGYRSGLLNKLSFGKFNNAFKPNRTLFDWLSRDETEVDKYISDPYCGFISSVQLMYHLLVSLVVIFDPKSIAAIRKDLPVYAFAGDKDPVGMQGKGFMKLIKNWSEAGIKNIEYKLYKDGRHEMLNEINRDEVMSDCLRWIKKQKKSS